MSHRPLSLISLAVYCAGFASADPVELYEYDGVLEIGIPYETILHGEIMHATLRLENRGNETIRVIKDGENDRIQLVWVAWENGLPVDVPHPYGTAIGSYKSSPVETFHDRNFSGYETEELDPGDSYEVSHVDIYSLGQSLSYRGDEAEFRPAFYGGEGKVIYGEPFSVKVVPKALTLFEKVFETEFIVDGNSSYQFKVYEVPIDGETYLFNSTGVRFCRVPPGVGYSISFKQEERERFATVDFDDPALDPLIFSWRKYNLISASRETVPWLFDKPEEDTPEKDVGEKSAAAKGGGARQSEPVGQGTRPADSKEAPGTPAWWPWIGAAAVFFVTALWAIRRRVA